MKNKYLPTAVLLVLAATSSFAATEAQKSFDSMKALQGSWTGTTSQGTTVKVTFRTTGGDSAIMSEIEGHGPNMITMFHLDGPRQIIDDALLRCGQPASDDSERLSRRQDADVYFSGCDKSGRARRRPYAEGRVLDARRRSSCRGLDISRSRQRDQTSI